MTPEQWRRKQEAQRLINWHRSALASVPEVPEVPANMIIQQGRIIAIDEASELTPEMLREFASVVQRSVERDLNLDFSNMMMGGLVRIGGNLAVEPEGRQTTGREILARQHGHQYSGLQRRLARRSNPLMQGPPDPQDTEAKYYKDKLGRSTANCYDRWLDITDSQGELEDFLWKCFQYGKRFKNEGELLMDDLEGRLTWRKPNG